MTLNVCAQCGRQIKPFENTMISTPCRSWHLHEGGCPRPYDPPRPTRKIPQ